MIDTKLVIVFFFYGFYYFTITTLVTTQVRSTNNENLYELPTSVLLDTLLSFGRFPFLPFNHLLLRHFFFCDAAQLMDVHLVELGQQVFDPVVTNGTRGSDEHARGHEDVVEDDPVQVGLFVEQLKGRGQKRVFYCEILSGNEN